MYLISSYLVLV